MYFCCLPEDDVTRGLLPPLIIYPRVGKSPKDRNIHHLKIKTAKSGPRLLTDVLPGAQGSRGDVTKSNRLNQSGTQLHGQPYGAVNHSPPPGTQLHHQSYAAKNQNPQIGSRLQNHQPQGQTYASEKLDQHGARSQNLQTGTQPYGARSQADNIKQILTCGSIVESDLQQEALLGRGNGGLVYKAIHRPTQRVMAVKVIELDVEIEVQRKILSELEILYRCHSCAIIGFYGAYFVENHISICTEYMDAGSLDKYGRVPEHVLGFMAVQIITGLLYMWNEKILHRDIKPSNMLVSQAGDVKLCDFGVSTQLVESIAQTYVGTNAYMALAMGEFPFKELAAQSNPYQLCRSILEETNPVLPAGQFSPELVDFVGRCMQKVAVQRITQAELMTHPYMQRYSKDGTSVISSWVKTQMPHAQPF